MCQTDQYPTEYDLAPISMESASPLRTEQESHALEALDLDASKRFLLARGAVRIAALIAKVIRALKVRSGQTH